MKTVTPGIGGTTCEGRATGVRTALAELDAVRRVDVSVKERTARVPADDEAQEATLVGTLQAAGDV